MWLPTITRSEDDGGGDSGRASREPREIPADKPVHCPRCGEYKGTTDGTHTGSTSQPCAGGCDSMEDSMNDAIGDGGGTEFPIQYSVQHIDPKYRSKNGIVQELQSRGYEEIQPDTITLSDPGKIHIRDHRDAVYGKEKEFLKLVEEHRPQFLKIIDEGGETHYLSHTSLLTDSSGRLKKMVSDLS